MASTPDRNHPGRLLTELLYRKLLTELGIAKDGLRGKSDRKVVSGCRMVSILAGTGFD
jgi:hypothetical protein